MDARPGRDIQPAPELATLQIKPPTTAEMMRRRAIPGYLITGTVGVSLVAAGVYGLVGGSIFGLTGFSSPETTQAVLAGSIVSIGTGAVFIRASLG